MRGFPKNQKTVTKLIEHLIVQEETFGQVTFGGAGPTREALMIHSGLPKKAINGVNPWD
jgi:hypothetical protein